MLGALIGLAGSVGSALIGGSSARQQQSAQRAADLQLQANNIAWEREQHQTRHQWETEDLRKAGLNPILSANSGGQVASASQGSGAMSSAPTPNLAQAITSGMEAVTAQKAQESASNVNDSLAELHGEQAQDLRDKRSSEFWEKLSSKEGSSASLNAANEKVALERLHEIKQNVTNLRAEEKEISSRIVTLRESISSMKAGQQRDRAAAALSAAEASLARAREKTENEIREVRIASEKIGQQGPIGREIRGILGGDFVPDTMRRDPRGYSNNGRGTSGPDPFYP